MEIRRSVNGQPVEREELERIVIREQSVRKLIARVARRTDAGREA